MLIECPVFYIYEFILEKYEINISMNRPEEISPLLIAVFPFSETETFVVIARFTCAFLLCIARTKIVFYKKKVIAIWGRTRI